MPVPRLSRSIRWAAVAGLLLAATGGATLVVTRSFALTTSLTGREPRIDVVVLRNRAAGRCLLRLTYPEPPSQAETLVGTWRERGQAQACVLPDTIRRPGVSGAFRGIAVHREPPALQWLFASGERPPVVHGSLTRMPRRHHATRLTTPPRGS